MMKQFSSLRNNQPPRVIQKRCMSVKIYKVQGGCPIMKHRNKSIQRCGKETCKTVVNTMKVTNSYRKSGKINKKQKNQFCQKHRKFHTTIVREAGPLEYLFYAILNTDLRMDQGTAAATIADGLITLYSNLDSHQVKCQYIDHWIQHGKRIIILKGYDHKHLKYLEEEVKFIAIDTFAVREAWGRNKAILMLAVFGLKEDLEEIFEGLSFLR